MKRLLLLTVILSSLLYAEVETRPVDRAMISGTIQIVDIRTPGEWRNTGLVKGSIPIMFFDAQGNYSLEEFLQKLNAKVDTKKQFALICNSGNRTRILSSFLSKNYGYNVINLQGGILHAIGKKLPLEPYKSK